MAQKRMFTMKIVDSDAFLDMPLSTQCLYFHLNMRADDDGFVGNAKRIMRLIGATEDDLKILLAKRFLIIFEDNVVVIKHWWMHNTLSKDRYHETSYTDQKALLRIKDNNSYTMSNEKETPCIQNVNGMLTECSQDVNADLDIDIDLVKDKAHISSCVPSYIPKIPKDTEEDCNTFYQDVFDLINSHNSLCKKKIPISRDIISFRCKEGYQLAGILQKESRDTVIQALKNYLKVANSKTWKNGFSFNAFCNNYFEYIDENFDMTKYLDLPKDRAKLINDFIDQKFKERLVFRIQTFIYHRKDWFAQGMPDGKELQELVKKWEEEDEKNKVNYGLVLADWEKDTA